MLDIKITRTTSPKEKPQDETKLGFGKIFTDHMFFNGTYHIYKPESRRRADRQSKKGSLFWNSVWTGTGRAYRSNSVYIYSAACQIV